MNKSMDRSRAEIVMFATAAFGIWMFVWSIILTNLCLGAFAFVIILSALIAFAIRNSD